MFWTWSLDRGGLCAALTAYQDRYNRDPPTLRIRVQGEWPEIITGVPVIPDGRVPAGQVWCAVEEVRYA